MYRLIVAILTPLILLAAVGGAVAWHDHGPGAHRARFLAELAPGDDRAPRLAIDVRQHTLRVLAAGNRACTWATAHPTSRTDGDPWASYAPTMTLTPGPATIQAEDIAESAWDALCPPRQTPGDDD